MGSNRAPSQSRAPAPIGLPPGHQSAPWGPARHDGLLPLAGVTLCWTWASMIVFCLALLAAPLLASGASGGVSTLPVVPGGRAHVAPQALDRNVPIGSLFPGPASAHVAQPAASLGPQSGQQSPVPDTKHSSAFTVKPGTMVPDALVGSGGLAPSPISTQTATTTTTTTRANSVPPFLQSDAMRATFEDIGLISKTPSAPPTAKATTTTTTTTTPTVSKVTPTAAKTPGPISQAQPSGPSAPSPTSTHKTATATTTTTPTVPKATTTAAKTPDPSSQAQPSGPSAQPPPLVQISRQLEQNTWKGIGRVGLTDTHGQLPTGPPPSAKDPAVLSAGQSASGSSVSASGGPTPLTTPQNVISGLGTRGGSSDPSAPKATPTTTVHQGFGGGARPGGFSPFSATQPSQQQRPTAPSSQRRGRSVSPQRGATPSSSASGASKPDASSSLEVVSLGSGIDPSLLQGIKVLDLNLTVESSNAAPSSTPSTRMPSAPPTATGPMVPPVPRDPAQRVYPEQTVSDAFTPPGSGSVAATTTRTTTRTTTGTTATTGTTTGTTATTATTTTATTATTTATTTPTTTTITATTTPITPTTSPVTPPPQWTAPMKIGLVDMKTPLSPRVATQGTATVSATGGIPLTAQGGSLGPGAGSTPSRTPLTHKLRQDIYGTGSASPSTASTGAQTVSAGTGAPSGSSTTGGKNFAITESWPSDFGGSGASSGFAGLGASSVSGTVPPITPSGARGSQASSGISLSTVPTVTVQQQPQQPQQPQQRQQPQQPSQQLGPPTHIPAPGGQPQTGGLTGVSKVAPSTYPAPGFPGASTVPSSPAASLVRSSTSATTTFAGGVRPRSSTTPTPPTTTTSPPSGTGPGFFSGVYQWVSDVASGAKSRVVGLIPGRLSRSRTSGSPGTGTPPPAPPGGEDVADEDVADEDVADEGAADDDLPPVISASEGEDSDGRTFYSDTSSSDGDVGSTFSDVSASSETVSEPAEAPKLGADAVAKPEASSPAVLAPEDSAGSSGWAISMAISVASCLIGLLCCVL